MARRFSRGARRSSSQWKKNHWSVQANALVTSSADEIVFVELLTPEDLGSTDFLQARATEKRIRGWAEWSLSGDVAVGNNQGILMAYIAKLDQSAVDGAIATAVAATLDPFDPELDEAYSGNSIMWTYGGQLLTTELATDPNSVAVLKTLWTEIDVPVNRRLEGDEAIYLVYKEIGSVNVNDCSLSLVTRVLFQE